MKIRVLYFASYQDLTGLAEEEVHVDEGSTVEALITVLKKRYESLGNIREILVAINNKFAEPRAALRENDRLAVFPSVSGG